MNRYLLVDGNSIAHWKFWATPLRQENGREVGMLHAVRDWIDKTAKRVGANHVLVVFDGANNWRRSVLPSYKQHRPPINDKLVEQLRVIREWLPFPSRIEDGKEGDDVIADYVHASDGGADLVVASGDKDLLQLVDDESGVSAYRPRERAQWREAEVIEKFGVPPRRLAEWLALVGDTSDGVPGVPGWGETSSSVGISASLDKKHLLELSAATRLPVPARLQRTLVDMHEHFERSFRLCNLRG